MITAVDTNVLLDVFTDDPRFSEAAQTALRDALRFGSLVACEPVWAEVAAAFASERSTRDAMGRVSVDFSSIGVEAAVAAGQSWREYRTRGGRRDRVVADFLIGAHALQQADRLLTRDRGFYRTYFSRLRVVDPEAP